MNRQNLLELPRNIKTCTESKASDLTRILIVDDEIESLGPLCDILIQWGYAVVCLTSAKESLEAIKNQDFDILMSDLVMPEIDGIQLLKVSRELNPNLICIIISGYATIQSAIEAMKIGAFDFVLKPFDFKMLRLTLSRAIKVGRLRKSENTYRSIVEDYQTEFICRFLPDGKLTFVNEAYCRYFDRPRQEIIGKNFLLFVQNEDKECVKKQHQSLNLETPVTKCQHRVLKPNGEIGWQDWIYQAIFDKQGNVAEVQSVGRDITDRKRVENALIESEEKYHALFDQAADLIAIIDIQGNFLDLNRKFEKESGWSRKDMIGKNAFTCGIFTETSRSNALFHLGQLLQGREPPIFEVEGIRKDGRKVPYELRATSIIKDNKIISVQAILRNLTERKGMEEELRKKMKELEEFYDIAVGRELRIKEIREEIETLKEELEKYKKL